MANPKGLRNRPIALEEGGMVMVYSNPTQILLQSRRETPTETDVLQPSFKVALALTPSEAFNLAGELLKAGSMQVTRKNTPDGMD